MSRSRTLCLDGSAYLYTLGFYCNIKPQCFVLRVLSVRLLWSKGRQPSLLALRRGVTLELAREKLQHLERVPGRARAAIHSGQREIYENVIRH